MDLERDYEFNLRRGHSNTDNQQWMDDASEPTQRKFPGVLDTVALYVSDECAGVHEMLFISTLIIMTDGVSQRLKLRSIAVMCGIVYILNIVRLVAFYPIAVDSCALDPNNPSCLNPVWEYHENIYNWGFLVVLVFMWLVWFWKVGGPERTLESKDNKDKFQFAFRKSWGRVHFAIMLLAALMLISSAYSVTTNDQAMEAKEILDFVRTLASQQINAWLHKTIGIMPLTRHGHWPPWG